MSKKKSSESTSGSAQTWAQPYAQAGASGVANVFNQNQPQLQQLTNEQRMSVVNPMLSRFNTTLGPANQASGYYSDVLGGKYLNGNPYMGQVMGNLNRGIADQVNSQFEGAGRYGSDAYAGTLARETGAADANLLYGNYSDEMNRMGQAAAGANAATSDATQGVTGAIGQQAELPYVGSNAYANSLGALFNGGKQVSYSPNPLWGAVGAGIGAAGSIFSDRRLKTKIRKVGEFEDGLGIYEFAYKSDPGHLFKGVMADEVKELRPRAYVPNYRGSGFDGVNYGAL